MIKKSNFFNNKNAKGKKEEIEVKIEGQEEQVKEGQEIEQQEASKKGEGGAVRADNCPKYASNIVHLRDAQSRVKLLL